MKILILHAYSAENAGDGLLVSETLALVKEALGDDLDITMLASRPDSFSHLPIESFPSVPTLRGYDRRFLTTLRSINSFDLVVGVGGGYLRAGNLKEAAKTLLVQGPQLLAASRARTPTIYLPQSVGPVKFGARRGLRSVIAHIDEFSLRDDRSVSEFSGKSTKRTPDLAAAGVLSGRTPGSVPDSTPVVSIRAVRGTVSRPVYELADQLGTYDAYIQSTTGGNNDVPATETLSPRAVLPRRELMTPGGTPRVVVAVRLHAALMALAAGHYVVHLAYERKGFGAYSDLGISRWVHNVNRFDPAAVAAQVHELLTNPGTRAEYDEALTLSGPRLERERTAIMHRIRRLASGA
ncbi:polysaccharide pyruvyl transferase family protein [Mycetocola zhadangensis]|uniref:polysaccharide pyruvyl transferase family protein n=1 Tax=Mycetocola zhadangensis TaxID=1164595 RepID=UPI003A4D23F0